MAEKGKTGRLRTLCRGRRIWLLAGGVLLGVLLLLLGSSTGKSEGTSAAGQDEMGNGMAALAQYKIGLERQIETLCESVSGVSSVEVMVTLERGYRVIYTTDGSGNPATTGNGSSESALYESILPPLVDGVGIVCHGGESPAVQRQLTELVSTALGIPSNRVFITGK